MIDREAAIELARRARPFHSQVFVSAERSEVAGRQSWRVGFASRSGKEADGYVLVDFQNGGILESYDLIIPGHLIDREGELERRVQTFEAFFNELCSSGTRIEAMKLWRSFHGGSLAEAKRAVEGRALPRGGRGN